jgi:putative transposase
MPNHVHFMTTPPTSDAIPAAMQAIGRRYVPFFNRRHRRTGALFEGRYRSFVVDNERYWMTCMRYIELNPVRAGLAATAGAYRWTSYRAHALGAPDLVVADHPVYLQLGTTPAERSHSWQAFCADDIPESELSAIRA